MTELLTAPSAVSVEKAEEDFDRENSLAEEAIAKLWQAFPENRRSEDVLLKVVVLNQLYGTRILTIHVWGLVQHIVDLNLDEALAKGSLEIVKQVACCTGLNFNYSFATKYCHWHNPDAYPIYDRNVDQALWAYKKQDGFKTFHHQDLWDYEKFHQVLREFQAYYGLTKYSFKALDKFLWAEGYKLLGADSEERSLTREAASEEGDQA